MKSFLRRLFKKQLYGSAYSRALFTLYGVVLKELKVCFHQFFTWKYPFYSFFRVIGIIFSSSTRIPLGRSIKYSFAFTGEDRIIESIFKPLITYNGFYVDIGCNHPIFLSNTYNLYRKGWKGICVDANSRLIKKFEKLRPRDTAVCALVSDKEEERDFYILENDVLSTTEAANLEHPDAENLTYSKTKIKSRTLTAILDEHHAPAEIDILSIDAEEHDYHVLKSLDFNRYSFRLIVVEDETFDLMDPGKNQVFNFLQSQGYILTGYILKNLYFIKNNPG